MKKHTHVVQLSDRRCTLTITEEQSRLTFELAFTKVGAGLDITAFKTWLEPILLQYENDRRPQVWKGANMGHDVEIIDLRSLS